MSVELWLFQPTRSPTSRQLPPLTTVEDGGYMGRSIVVLEADPKLAQSLAGGLRPHFSVHLTRSREELRERLAKYRPEAVVLNMECSRWADVQSLHQDFPAVPIVCTHRVPDEEMWMAALEAGASDVCPVDVEIVLTSVRRSMALSHTAAA
jgi:DNA-binding NtrC family response regulator